MLFVTNGRPDVGSRSFFLATKSGGRSAQEATPFAPSTQRQPGSVEPTANLGRCRSAANYNNATKEIEMKIMQDDSRASRCSTCLKCSPAAAANLITSHPNI